LKVVEKSWTDKLYIELTRYTPVPESEWLKLLPRISLSDYKKLLAGHICWQTITSKLTQEIFIEKEKREREFLSDDAETRYLNFIQKYSGIEKRINQYQIASYLGISHVTLSRIRKNQRNSSYFLIK
jgi:CRP-like cAMP-binding protein